jgi:hypothetical protein
MNTQNTINTTSEELNATFPTFNQLTKELLRIEGEKNICIANPLIWACDYDDRRIIHYTMNAMCSKMQGFGFAVEDGDQWAVMDWKQHNYYFNETDFECLLKIMFCSWLNIGIIDETNSELYYAFKSQEGVFQVLN